MRTVVEQGYLELALLACEIADAGELEARAARALELALEFGDSELEARALADSGLALVSQGRFTEGFARLDEAMVPVISGEVANGGAIFCSMLSACERVGDVRRAEEWIRLCQEIVLDDLDGWIAFSHVEADECGAVEQFLAAAPNAQVAHGATGCAVSLDDMLSRPPVPLADGEVIALGGSDVSLRSLQHVDTPHVPHNWESRVLFEETTGTLCCDDLFTQTGNPPAVTSEYLVYAAIAAEGCSAARRWLLRCRPPCESSLS